MDVVQRQEMRVDPEYIENFRKDLLANVYDVNPRYNLPETLQRRENYEPPELVAQGESMPSEFFYTDFEGNEVDFDPSTIGLVDDETLGTAAEQFSKMYDPITGAFNVPQDVSGFAAESTLNNVPQPDIMPLTPMQQQAIRMSAQGIGAYEPMLDVAEDTFNKGIAATDSSLGGYDPSSYQGYMTPYEDVIDATYKDMDRQGLANMYDLNQSAIGSGAFGGSRGAVARQENARNIRDQKASFGAKIRMDAVNNARSQSMTAFENQAKRGQTAGQIFQGLGTAQAGLGQLGQDLGIRDQQNVLGMGGLEQQQMQAEYDVQRASAIEQNMEPYSRFGFMGDIASGLPSGNSAITVGTAPAQNTLGSTVAASLGIAQLGKQINRGS